MNHILCERLKQLSIVPRPDATGIGCVASFGAEQEFEEKHSLFGLLREFITHYNRSRAHSALGAWFSGADSSTGPCQCESDDVLRCGKAYVPHAFRLDPYFVWTLETWNRRTSCSARRGGLTIVLDPREAEYPDMPENAMEGLPMTFCLNLADIGPALERD